MEAAAEERHFTKHNGYDYDNSIAMSLLLNTKELPWGDLILALQWSHPHTHRIS